MPKYVVTIVEELEHEFEIEADSAEEANDIALTEDVTEAIAMQFHSVRILHPAEEIADG